MQLLNWIETKDATKPAQLLKTNHALNILFDEVLDFCSKPVQ
jgi:hypothetical protein